MRRYPYETTRDAISASYDGDDNPHFEFRQRLAPAMTLDEWEAERAREEAIAARVAVRRTRH